MRKIKFRGKRIDNGEWVYGYYTSWKHFNGKGYENVSAIFEHDLGTVLIHPETVGQFTGLHDKDGKEIWEGDLVSDEMYNGVVFYNEDSAQFQVDFSPVEECPQEMMKHNNWAKIVGNIHDNPELI